MTLADLAYGLIYTLSRPFLDCFPRLLCGPYYIIIWTCQLGSVSFLFLLNIDKFIRIRFILQYRRWVTASNVIKITLLYWMAMIGTAVYNYYGPYFHYREGHESTDVGE